MYKTHMIKETKAVEINKIWWPIRRGKVEDSAVKEINTNLPSVTKSSHDVTLKTKHVEGARFVIVFCWIDWFNYFHFAYMKHERRSLVGCWRYRSGLQKR